MKNYETILEMQIFLLLDKYELEYIWGKGDHLNVRHPKINYILTIPAHKPIKPIYIIKLLKMID